MLLLTTICKLVHRLSIGTNFNDLESPWTTVMHHFTLHFFFPDIAVWKLLKTDLYCQQQKQSQTKIKHATN